MAKRIVERFEPTEGEVDALRARTSFDKAQARHYLRVQKMEETIKMLRDSGPAKGRSSAMLDLFEALLPSQTPWW